jgi:hypothetical protein
VGSRCAASALVTVAGGGGALLIAGTVRDEAGNPVAGAVINNNMGLQGAMFSATNFIGSNPTASNGQYMIRVRSNSSNNIVAHHDGHAFICNRPGGSITGVVVVAGSSVANVDFTRTNTLRTIGGPVYLAGASPRYNPVIHGTLTVHGGTNRAGQVPGQCAHGP